MLILRERPAPTGNLGIISAYNPDGGHRRADMATTNLPCPRGTVRLGASLSIDGTGTGQREQIEWQAWGPRWDDGSVKIARSTFPTLHAPGETLDMQVALGQGANQNFALHPVVAAALPALNWRLRIGADILSLTSWTQLQAWGQRTQMRRYVGRFSLPPFDAKEQFWLEVWLQLGSGLRHHKFWARFGNSYARTNPQAVTNDSQYPFNGYQLDEQVELIVGCAAPIALNLEHELPWTFGKTVDPQQDVHVLVLDPAQMDPTLHQFPDGTSYPLVGSIVFLGGTPTQLELDTEDAESTRMPVVAKSQGWIDAGLANPMWENVVPPTPAWFAPGEAEYNANLLGLSQIGSWPYRAPFSTSGANVGLSENANQTGDQAAFRRIHGWPNYRTKSVIGLLNLKMCALWEMRRAKWFREWNTCDPILAANHQQCEEWLDRPFTNGSTELFSPDLLGKNRTQPVFERIDEDAPAHRPGITEPNREHWDFLFVTHAAQLTGDWLLMQMVLNIAENWKLIQATTGFSSVINGASEARAKDRVWSTGAHLYHLTGDDGIRAIMDLRSDREMSELIGPPTGIQIFNEDNNWGYASPYFPPQSAFAPWQLAMSVAGWMASYYITRNPNALMVAKTMSRAVCKFCLDNFETPSLQCIVANREYGNPGYVLARPGDIYIERNSGGTEVARGTFVGERADGTYTVQVYLKNCSAIFPGRFGAILQNQRDPGSNRTVQRNRGGVNMDYQQNFNNGVPLTQAEREEWDPVGKPPAQPFEQPAFTRRGLADAITWWGAPAFAYGVRFAQEANDALWLANAQAGIRWVRDSIQRPAGFGWGSEPDKAAEWLALPNVWP